MQGRRGPVVIVLPENILTEKAAVSDAPSVDAALSWPAPPDIEQLGMLLSKAKAPFVILGGSGWDEAASKRIARFAERFDLPVATSFRRASLFDAGHPNYAGDLGVGPDPRLKARITDADLILLIGGRMSEMPSLSYTLLDVPSATKQLVGACASRRGRAWSRLSADARDSSEPDRLCSAVDTLRPAAAPAWAGEAAKANCEYVKWTETPRELPGPFQYGKIVAWWRDRLPTNAIICNGAGNYTGWLHRHHRFHAFAAQLAPTSGSMGYGMPAAVLAKRQFPDRVIVAFAGDGCFLMNGQEFSTAVRYSAAIIVILIDNSQYGTIPMHQEREYPGRVIGTQLQNPDFALYARAFGGYGERVERTQEFGPAFECALASGKPAILHCLLDPRAISVGKDSAPTSAKAMR